MKAVKVFAWLMSASFVQPALSATFNLEGSAGTLSAPILEWSDPTGAAPLIGSIPNGLAGTRSATADGYVDNGIVRVNSEVSVDAGTASIGNIQAEMEGGWTDTLTFNAPGVIPSLPGVIVSPGVMGMADLTVNITGALAVSETSGVELESRYSASLSYGPNGSSGQAQISDVLDFADIFNDTFIIDASNPPGPAVPPNQLVLNVSFLYGTAFDVQFSLSSRARLGFEGNAPADLVVQALLGDSATWSGVQNVQAMVDDGAGGLVAVDLPESAWSLTGAEFDYTSAVTVIPVPAAIWLFGSALALLGWRRRMSL